MRQWHNRPHAAPAVGGGPRAEGSLSTVPGLRAPEWILRGGPPYTLQWGAPSSFVTPLKCASHLSHKNGVLSITWSCLLQKRIPVADWKNFLGLCALSQDLNISCFCFELIRVKVECLWEQVNFIQPSFRLHRQKLFSDIVNICIGRIRNLLHFSLTFICLSLFMEIANRSFAASNCGLRSAFSDIFKLFPGHPLSWYRFSFQEFMFSLKRPANTEYKWLASD